MLIDKFFKTGQEFLGCRVPIMCGAMTWVSDPQLVTAMGRAGGFGLLAGGNAPVTVFKEQIETTRRMSDHPFGVNIITLAPVYPDQLNLACDMGCQYLVFAGGIPKKVEKFWVGALKKAVIDGDVTKGSLMAGQSVGLVKQVMPLKDIIDEFTRDAEAELQRLKTALTD
jgi:NAD(P)H-dependent flavin oxidoreductase YrpB (nitropropane dioxygenase family)